ncbi:MAG: cell division ATP-binding protein FtsE [Selenomonadales bacterium]|nr:cell division ATP-binding protein FtsE [Selenomonadales bacterium]
MITLSNVSKTYSTGAVAMDDLSVSIEKGEFVFIVGPSGAGKSTFIKMLLLEETPDKGDLIVNGRNLRELPKKKIPYLRRSMGVIFQDYRLLPDKTVYENVAFAMRVVEASRKEMKQNIERVLGLVGLTHKAKSFPSQLSGGEQQRVAIARAIVNNPVIVIADEPTGNLDPETSWEIMNIFDEINKSGTTIVMATHDKDVVNSMRRRVIALEKGKIVRDEAKGGYGYEN